MNSNIWTISAILLRFVRVFNRHACRIQPAVLAAQSTLRPTSRIVPSNQTHNLIVKIYQPSSCLLIKKTLLIRRILLHLLTGLLLRL